jgi:TrmH family RNA methyltransferase
MQITSTANPRIKAAARLRDRRGRDDQGRIIIDGVREIGRALAAGAQVVELYYCPQLCPGDESQRLMRQVQQVSGDVIEVTPPVMDKLAFGNRGEGVVAVGLPPQRTLADLKLPPSALIAVVERVEKPGNLGAILRTADAAGVGAVIVAGGITDLYNPNAIRASLGAIFTVPICAAPVEQVLDWLRLRGCRILAARVDGAIDYTAADFRGPAAIVLGSEAAGLSQAWQGDDIVAVRLPMLGQVDSLNLSATAAVLFYEALRQRQQRSEPGSPGGT